MNVTVRPVRENHQPSQAYGNLSRDNDRSAKITSFSQACGNLSRDKIIEQAADCYRKVIDVIRANPDDYDPGFEAVFHKLVDRLDSPAAP